MTMTELEGARVLLVDDDEDGRVMLGELLGELGATVTMASTAAEALQAFAGAAPNVLISDIDMPIEDGYSLLRQVRALGAARGGELFAVAVSGHAKEDAPENAFDAHLCKPITLESLVAVLRHVLDHPRSARLRLPPRGPSAPVRLDPRKVATAR